MSSRRPVNRVTPRNRPSTGQAAATARTARKPEPTAAKSKAAARPPVRTPRVAGARAPRSAPARRVRVRRPLGSGWWLIAGCLLVAAVLATFAVIAAQRPGADTNQAFANPRATDEVTAAADHALRSLFSYDVNKLDGYRETARSVVTGQMLTDFDKFVNTNYDVIKQTGTSADVQTKPVGVTLLTDDRAELLVNLVISASKNGTAQESASGPIVLRMAKKDGRWLASDIVDR